MAQILLDTTNSSSAKLRKMASPMKSQGEISETNTVRSDYSIIGSSCDFGKFSI